MSRWHDQTVDEERSFPGVSSSSGEAVKEELFCSKAQGRSKVQVSGEGEKPDESLVRSGVLFRLVTGDKQFS